MEMLVHLKILPLGRLDLLYRHQMWYPNLWFIWVNWEGYDRIDSPTYDISFSFSELFIWWGQAYWGNWSRPDIQIFNWQSKARPGYGPIKLQNGDVIFIGLWLPIFVNLHCCNVECFILCFSFLTNQSFKNRHFWTFSIIKKIRDIKAQSLGKRKKNLSLV